MFVSNLNFDFQQKFYFNPNFQAAKVPQYVQRNFDIANQLKDLKCVKKNQYSDLLKNANKKNDFALILGRILNNNFDDYMQKIMEKFDINELIKNQNITKAIEKSLKALNTKYESMMVSACRIVAQKDTNSEVLKIKNELAEMGVETSFDNNLSVARKCLKAMKFLKSKNFPLPDEIISENILESCFATNIKNKKIIVLDSDCINKKGFSVYPSASTDSPIHEIVHECVHLTQPSSLSYMLKQLPEKYREIADNLSGYARENYFHEVHAELVTKKLLSKLTKDEEMLFNYMES